MTPNGRQSSPDAASDTTSRYNGWGQRFLRENDLEQSVFSYGLEGFTLLSQTTRRLATAQQSTTEHIWLPTASGPMPVAAVIDGVHYAVHADHLNTPRRLSDATGQTRWQWPYSGFGEIAPQATPATGQAPVSFALRYPGQIDDGNELFYNWHRFYEPRVGRYTKADPIGLDGGWNRFGYAGGNPLSYSDPKGLQAYMCGQAGLSAWCHQPPAQPPTCMQKCIMKYGLIAMGKTGAAEGAAAAAAAASRGMVGTAYAWAWFNSSFPYLVPFSGMGVYLDCQKQCDPFSPDETCSTFNGAP